MRAILLFVTVGLVLVFGIGGYIAAGDAPLDAIYKTIQLFGLNYEAPGRAGDASLVNPANTSIQIARFLAAAMLAAAVAFATARALWRQALAWVSTRVRRPHLILGWGHVAQEIAKLLRDAEPWAPIVAVAQGATREQRDAAAANWIALVSGDPSDTATLDGVRLTRAHRVFVALDDDMASLDAAEAVRSHLAGSGHGRVQVRLFVRRASLTRLAQASASGFMTSFDSTVHALRSEAARSLVSAARLDRIAQHLGQDRVHAVVVACGGQGRALLEEVLRQEWRIDLEAPAVTVVDRQAGRVRQRLSLSAPFLMAAGASSVEGVIDGWHRPDFIDADIADLDFSASEGFREALRRHGPVTAFIVACPDEAEGLRASLRLHALMVRREIPAAAVFLRIWAGHSAPAQNLASRRISLVRPFGSVAEGLIRSEALADDPDEMPVRFNAAYNAASLPDATDPVASWEGLPEAKRESNRALYRNAERKLEDLGLEVKHLPGTYYVAPQIPDDICRRIRKALKGGDFAARLPHEPAREMQVAMREHDRFVMERALAGWQPVRPGEAWDDGRQRNPYLVRWEDIPDDTPGTLIRPGGKVLMTKAEQVRRYDAALIAGLMDLGGQPRQGPRAVPKRRAIVELNGLICSHARADLAKCSTLIVLMSAMHVPGDAAVCDLIRSLESLVWLTLVFRAPPTPQVLDLAERFAAACPAGSDRVAVRVETVWGWTENDVFPGIRAMEAEARAGNHSLAGKPSGAT